MPVCFCCVGRFNLIRLYWGNGLEQSMCEGLAVNREIILLSMNLFRSQLEIYFSPYDPRLASHSNRFLVERVLVETSRGSGMLGGGSEHFLNSSLLFFACAPGTPAGSENQQPIPGLDLDGVLASEADGLGCGPARRRAHEVVGSASSIATTSHAIRLERASLRENAHNQILESNIRWTSNNNIVIIIKRLR